MNNTEKYESTGRGEGNKGRKGRGKRLFAMLLVMALVMNNVSFTSSADSAGAESGTPEIITFAVLPEDVAVQNLAVGAAEEEINLPDTLTAEISAAGKTVIMETAVPAETAAEAATEEDTAAAETESAEETTDEQKDSAAGTTAEDKTAGGERKEAEAAEQTAAAGEKSASDDDHAGSILRGMFGLITSYAAEPEETGSIAADPEETEGIAAETGSADETESGMEIRTVEIRGIHWELNAELSDSAEFSSEKAGKTYVYLPVLPEKYVLGEDAELPQIEVRITAEGFSQSTLVNGMTIAVTADPGVFPAGAYFKATEITEKTKINDIRDAIADNDAAEENAATEEAAVDNDAAETVTGTGMRAFDITIFDKNSQEIQPDTAKGTVQVTFKEESLKASAESAVQVYHMDETLETAERLDANVDAAAGTAEVEAEHFSVYAVVAGGYFLFTNFLNFSNGDKISRLSNLTNDNGYDIRIYFFRNANIMDSDTTLNNYITGKNVPIVYNELPGGYKLSIDSLWSSGTEISGGVANVLDYWLVGNVKDLIDGDYYEAICLFAPIPYSVTVTRPTNSHMTRESQSGLETQSGLGWYTGMTPVVYTADSGYCFPESYSVTDSNGISVTRNSASQITVSGIPTNDASITLAPALLIKGSQAAPTGVSGGNRKITGTTTAMEYSTNQTDWTACTGTEISGLNPGTYYVRYKATDTLNESSAVSVIVTAQLTPSMIKVNPDSAHFTGSAIAPVVTVTDGNKTLVSGTDYTLSGDTSEVYPGTYTIYVQGKGNYTGTINCTWLITRATMTYTPNDYSGIYDGTAHSATVTVTAPTGADITYSTTQTGTYSTAAPSYTNAGSYTVYYKIQKTGYIDVTGTLKVDISAKPVTVTAQNAAKVYGDADPAFTWTAAGLVSGESLNGITISRAPGETAATGGYWITPHETMGANPNYSITLKIGTFTINKKTVTVTPAAGQFKIFGAADPSAFTYTASGLVGSDTLTGALSREEGENAGRYAFTPGTLANGNYTITLAANAPTFEISAKSLTDSMLKLAEDSFTYTGRNIEPAFTMQDSISGQDAVTLTDGTDYQIITAESITSAADVGSYTIKVAGKGNYTGTASCTWQITDPYPPTGAIEVGNETGSRFTTFLHNITFGRFFKETQPVKITAEDVGSGVDGIYYTVSGTALSEEALGGGTVRWTAIANGGSFSKDPDRKLIVYVKITDRSGNVTCISTDGLVLDRTAPVISGVTDGTSYCESKAFAVQEDFLKSVTVDGQAVTLQDGSYTIAADNREHVIAAADQAGNVTEVSVSIYTDHLFGDWVVTKPAAETEKGSMQKTCVHCGIVQTQDIPALLKTAEGRISGTVRGDKNARYTVTVTAVDGTGDVQILHGFVTGDTFVFEKLPDGIYNLTVTDEDSALGYAVTRMITIKDGAAVTGIEIEIGAEFTQVIVEEGAPDTAVDGLQELFETPVFNADPEAAGAVSGGGSVKIILETSQTDSDAEDRLEAAAKENGKQIGMTFDLKVKMIITSSGGTTKEKRITDTGEMLTVVLPLKDTVPENADITVLREHEGGISYLPELSGSERLSAEKEGFYIQDMRIFLRVHRFSAYSLLYSERTGDGTGDDTEVIDRNVPGTWVSISDGGWQYRLTDGSYAKNRWCFIGNVWYYFNKDSRMQTGWIREPEDIWYYLDPLTGAMRTGMLTAPDGHRYYFYGNGMMAAGDVYYNGKLLKFNSVRPSVPTYDLSADGSWVKNDYMTELPYGAELEEQA